MTDPFASPKQRIGRAKQHLRTFIAEGKKFSKKNPWISFVEDDPETGKKFHKVKLRRKFPTSFTDLGMEIIESLRSALDQAAFATAIFSGATNAKHAYFPFADTAAQLETVINGRCKDIPPDIIALFREFKPYQGGDDLIWALNKIRQNTHKLLVPVGVLSDRMKFNYLAISGGGGIRAPNWDSVKNEMILFEVEAGGKIDYDINLSFHIAFGEIDPVRAQPVVPFFDAATRKIESIVMAIEAEFRRINRNI